MVSLIEELEAPEAAARVRVEELESQIAPQPPISASAVRFDAVGRRRHGGGGGTGTGRGGAGRGRGTWLMACGTPS